jgi:hypothetical protein
MGLFNALEPKQLITETISQLLPEIQKILEGATIDFSIGEIKVQAVIHLKPK